MCSSDLEKMISHKSSQSKYALASLLEECLLKGIMWLGFVCGCTPALLLPTARIHSVSTHPFKNIGIIYCLVVGVLQLLTTVDFFASDFGYFTKGAVSQILVNFVSGLALNAVDLVRRLVFVWKFPQLVRVFRYLHHAKEENTAQGAEGRGSGTLVVLMVVYLLLVTAENVLELALVTEQGWDQPSVFPRPLAVFTWYSGLVLIYASSVVAKALVHLVGNRLVAQFQRLCAELQQLHHLAMAGQEEPAVGDQLLAFKFRFEELEEGFETYSDAVGLLMALTILEAITLLFAQIFKAFDVLSEEFTVLGLGMELCGYLEAGLGLAQLGQMGQFMRDEMKAYQRRLQRMAAEDKLLRKPFRRPGQHSEAVNKFIYKAIPRVIGYVVFCREMLR